MSLEVIHLDGVLNSASRGLDLARDVSVRLEKSESIEIDCQGVARVTPSFANAFVMTLAASDPAVFRSRVHIRNASSHVDDAFQSARDRFARGIRLTTQLA